jgi:glycosyltransferase involved in cell wall biosynthesis
MSAIQQRAREKMGWDQDEHGASYEQVKAVFQAAHEALRPGAPFHPQVLGPEEEWEVPTPLVFESHRGFAGRAIVFLKRRVLFPLNRWLHSYTWHNLRRQQKLNLLLLSAVESLAVSHARLAEEMEALRPREPQPASEKELFARGVETSRAGSDRRMKLAFVVDRYGADVPGGSERHCREFAERLAKRGHEVTVLTSCARDYVTWANAYSAGVTKESEVTVLRFSVAAERDQGDFRDRSRRVFAGLGTEEEERAWFQANGPYVPSLVEHLRTSGETFDLVIFFSYRYYPTFAGLPLVASRAILVPTAEEDPAIRLGVLRKFFTLPLGIVHNTREEQQLIRSVTRGPLPAFEVIGSGVDEPHASAEASRLEALGVRRPFVLCLGRVDPNKGSVELLSNFRRFVEHEGERVQLVLAGQAVFDVPAQRGVVMLGHVSDDDRAALLHHMVALVAPSAYESLSLALIEAWMCGRPALVNGWCKALKGQVNRADGGLYYENAGEFREALRFLLDEPATAERLGLQGLAHARENYAWPVVMNRLEGFLQARLSARAAS